MTVERYIRIFAGIFILASLALGIESSPLFVSSWALAFTAFVGAICFSLALPMSALWVGCCVNWGYLTQCLASNFFACHFSPYRSTTYRSRSKRVEDN